MPKAPSLSPCPGCGTPVASTARSCPSCGAVLRKPRRGFFGKLWLWLFIAFNALMLVWLVGGSKAAVEGQQGLVGAELAGAQIGTGLGVMMIVFFWVAGAVVLGLFALLTRPK